MSERAERAEQLVQWGELSSARPALEGAPVAPGNDATLRSLQDPRKRPPLPREPLPREVVDHQPDSLLQLDHERILKNLRSSRRGQQVDRQA